MKNWLNRHASRMLPPALCFLLVLLTACVLAVALAVPARAQSGADVRFRNINMEHGLPSYGVRSLLQDAHGFIWLGTDNGLCSYDGIRIRRFVAAELGQDQYISTMAQTPDAIIVGTNDGVFRFDTHRERFERLLPELRTGVTSVTIDRDSTLWVATDGDGIHGLNPKNGSATRHQVGQDLRTKVNYVYTDRDNQVWALSVAAPYIYRLNRASRTFVPLSKTASPQLVSNTCMLQTADGTLYVGTWNAGPLRLDKDGTVVEVIPRGTGRSPAAQTRALLEAADAHLIVVCGQGLIDVSPRTGAWKRLEMTADPMAVNGRFAYAALIDHEQGLWCSTFYGGVNYISPVGSRFESFRPASGGLQGNVVENFAEDARGRIWIGTDDGGLSCYDAESGQFVDFPRRAEFASLNIHALLVDGDELWIGTYGNGVCRMNLSTGSVRQYGRNDGLNDNSGYSFHKDAKGRLWVGTMSTACLFDSARDRFETLQHFKAICSSIQTDRQGRVWFATQNQGLWRYEPGKKKWKQYRTDNAQEGGLPADEVNALSMDAQGRLLVATSVGLCVLDAKTETFEQVPLPLASHRVCAIVPDGTDIWLSTVEGVVRLMDDGKTQLFNRHDGLVADQFMPNASLLASDGHVYFGGLRGFSRFLPYDIELNRRPPHVFITGLSVNNRQTEVGSEVLPKALQYMQTLSLAYNQNNITLQFTALSYCSPEKNQYSYMLEGFDADWTMAGPTHMATYTNLPPGTYTFRVKATNNDGVWSTEEARLEIVVHPPFWWSVPAKLFYLLLAVAGIWLYTHLRLKRARHQHRQELRLLKEKQKAEAEKQRLEFFTTIAHEIRTPVSLIIAPLDNVVNRLKSVPAARNVDADLGIIGRNANRLLELVNQLLDFSKVQQTGLPMRFRRQPLVPVMERVAERFIPSLRQKGIAFESQLPADKDFCVDIDHEGLTKVVSNLMNNALKYARSHVQLACSISPDATTFTIRVSDDGKGIPEAEQKKIFQPFYQAENNKPGTGIGLSIVQRIVEQHGGSAHVESEVGKGTTFDITLPVRQLVVTTDETDAELAREAEKMERTQPQTPPQEAEKQSRTSVLVVEDNDDMRSFLATHFAETYRVLEAENGRTALEQLQQHAGEVSLIVSDWMMPEMDGLELCRAVRSDTATSHIPFVLLTAKTDDLSKVEGMDTGADAYIEKPFSVQYLEACIRRMISARRELLLRFSSQPDMPVTAIATSSVDNDLLQRLERAIEANITHPQLSVAFLAEQLNMSRSSLFSKIRALTEQTPNEMIQMIRLRHAARLLSEGHYRVNEVSAAVGFNNASYFAKCFARQFGCKPTEYGVKK